jgi:hypothetical protein
MVVQLDFVDFNEYVDYIYEINNADWIRKNCGQESIEIIDCLLKKRKKRKMFREQDLEGISYESSRLLQLFFFFGMDIDKVEKFILGSFLRAYCLINCHNVDKIKKILYTPYNWMISIELDDIIPITPDLFDCINKKTDYIKKLNFSNINYSHAESLGYFLWRGDVNDVDMIVKKYEKKNIIDKYFFIREDNIDFFDMLTKKTGCELEFAHKLVTDKFEEEENNLFYQFLKRKGIEYEFTSYSFIILKLNGEIKFVKIENINIIILLVRKRIEKKRKIVKKIINWIVRKIMYSDKKYEYIEEIINDYLEGKISFTGNKKYNNFCLWRYYFLCLLKNDKLEKLKEMIECKNLINISNIKKNDFNFMILYKSRRCIDYMMNILKIKPLIDTNFLVKNKFDDDTFLKHLVFIKEINIPDKGVEYIHFLGWCLVKKMNKSAEYILENIPMKLGIQNEEIIIRDREIFMKYYDKIDLRHFFLVSGKGYGIRDHSLIDNIIEVIEKFGLKLKKIIIRNIKLALILSGRKDQYYKFKGIFPDYKPTEMKILLELNQENFDGNPMSIIIATEEYGTNIMMRLNSDIFINLEDINSNKLMKELKIYREDIFLSKLESAIRMPQILFSKIAEGLDILGNNKHIVHLTGSFMGNKYFGSNQELNFLKLYQSCDSDKIKENVREIMYSVYCSADEYREYFFFKLYGADFL